MPGLTRDWTPGWPIDLARTLAPLAHSSRDPAIRISGREAWWASRTPEGPVTLHVAADQGVVQARAWGPGADHQLDALPVLLGAGDDPTGFPADAHPVMQRAFARFGAGWRVLRTTRVLEALAPAVLEQRVTGRESRASWSALVRRFGTPAPHSGEPGAPVLHVPPDGAAWAAIPSWEWHRAGVDHARSSTLVAAARRAAGLEALSGRAAVEAGEALRSLPGIGAWTAAEVGVRAWGDIDAVSFGDFHLARAIVHALTGRTDGDDAQMAELLEPWAGQRARAVRLLELHAGHVPRRGPRSPITDHRHW